MNTKPLPTEFANSTDKEKLFLDGIVSGKWVKEHPPGRARKALHGYLDTAHIRKWDDGVSVPAVINHAKRLIAELA